MLAGELEKSFKGSGLRCCPWHRAMVGKWQASRHHSCQGLAGCMGFAVPPGPSPLAHAHAHAGTPSKEIWEHADRMGWSQNLAGHCSGSGFFLSSSYTGKRLLSSVAQ